MSGRCRTCDAKVPPGVDQCPACRTERLPIADLGSGPILTDLPAPDQKASAPPPLIGRDRELQQLCALAAEAAQQNEVRFCLVTAPGGAGKTRLLRELSQSLGRQAPPLRVLCGSACEGGPPFAVFAELLRQRFHIDPREPAPAAREKLLLGCQALLPGDRAAEAAQLLGELMGLPPPEDAPAPAADGARGARVEPRLYLAVRRLLSADAGRAPLALLFDEMEHASQEAVNLLHYLSAGLLEAPVFLCAFARPEIDEVHPSFGEGEVPCARLDLPPLPGRDSVALLRSLAGSDTPCPQRVVRHVEAHFAGVPEGPRAIVELVRLLEETEVLERSCRGAVWHGDLLEPLPTTLDDLVAARLDEMEPAHRELLEQAAVCGERFWVDAVVALIRCREVGLGLPAAARAALGAEDGADPDGPALEEIVVAGDRATHHVTATLSQLTERGLVQPLPHSAIRGEREYRFCYPPWRDAVYDGIPLPRRKAYHGVLAQWLELSADSARPEGEDAQELIGRHLEKAGQGDAAAVRYQRAAAHARDRYAHARATRLYARAIACLGTADLSTRIRLWHELGRVFHGKGDYDNALSAYEKVVRLSWVAASRGKAALALLHTGQIWRLKGELQLALDYLGQALDLFHQAEDGIGISDTLDEISQALWFLGRYAGALSRAQVALEMRRRLGDRRKVAASLLSLGNIERHRGHFEDAEPDYHEALALYRNEGDKAGVAACLNALGMLAYQRGEVQRARHQWEEALGLVEEVGASPLRAVLLCHLGEGLLQQGAHAEARARFTEAYRLAQELSDKRLLSASQRALGLLAQEQGDVAQARRQCEAALRLAEETGVKVEMGRALLALGEVHAATLFGGPQGGEGQEGEPQAREYLRRGVALLREIGNDAELAEGLLRMGRYHVERGQVEEGRALLKEAEGLFTRLRVLIRAGEVRSILSEL